jgi:hypothetical protein
MKPNDTGLVHIWDSIGSIRNITEMEEVDSGECVVKIPLL